VVACVALLVALGGTGVAAVSQVARDSVRTAQLKANAVTTPKIRNNAVTSEKVRNRSLLAVDFGRGQIPQGPQGEQGPAGPQGTAGAAGPQGLAGPQGRWAHVLETGAIVGVVLGLAVMCGASGAQPETLRKPTLRVGARAVHRVVPPGGCNDPAAS